MIVSKILYHNLLESFVSYSVIKGVDSTYAPMSNAFDTVPTSSALPIADSTGTFEVSISVNKYTTGYGSLPYGRGGYGGGVSATAFVMGVSRHDPSLHRFAGGRLTVTSNDDGIVLIDNLRLGSYPVNLSFYKPLHPHTTASYTIKITELAADSQLSFPSLYIGNSISFGGMSYNIDDYQDRANYKTFESGTGVGYSLYKFNRFTIDPNFENIDVSLWGQLADFREGAIEKSKPFWWMTDETREGSIFLVKQRGNFAKSPIVRSNSRTMRLMLDEWL